MKAPESAAGKRGPCKGCGATVTVPAAGPTAAVSTAIQTTAVIVQEASQVPTFVPPPVPTISPLLRRFTNDQQDPAVVAGVLDKVEGLLMTDEELRYIAVQQKPIANLAPDAIVLTNKRFMWFKMKLLGRYDFADYVWRELRDARITEGMLGATITIITARNERLSVDYLPKRQAREVYRFAQEMEEKAAELRRQRSLEEARAASGGTTIAVNTSGPQPAANDPFAKLAQLKQMLDAGLISQAEFAAKKAELLASL
jgi:hypothetical protein